MSAEDILKNNGDKRNRCIVYTRVMGYHRPVESFNVGKTGEHRERVKFQEPSAIINNFVCKANNPSLSI
jgi:hypothetical protein